MSSVPNVTAEIDKLEKDFDDDTESIITNEKIYIHFINY